jgi:hypothetical protein
VSGSGTEPPPPAPAPSIADALRDVEVVWVRRGETPPDSAWRFSVRWLEPRPRSAALGYLENPGAFRGPAVDDRRPVVALFVIPSFDDVVALAMWAWERAGRGRPGGPAWDAVAHYADNVRQGLLPETVPPTRAPQSVYRAIAELRLTGDRRGFVEPALWFVELLVAKVAEGKSLFHDDLVSTEPFLVEYLDLLRDDERRYREDRRRAERLRARIPADAAGGVDVALPLLAVSSPRATHFRIWAQRDPEAPGGAGWPLLAIQRRPVEPGLTDVQITAMPSAKVTLSFLADPLTAAERSVAGAGAGPWYAGADYDDRMVASPEEGTRLSLHQVVDAISGPLALRRVRPGWVLPSAAAGVLFAAFAVAAVVRPGWLSGWRGVEPVQPPSIAQGQRARELADARAAFASRKDRALLVATDRYGDPRWRSLGYPVKQALLLEAALRRRGFSEITLLQNPTHAQLIAELKKSNSGTAWSRYDQLLVYFSGHGAMFEELGTGRLVLADSSGDASAYLSLADLRVFLMNHASRHVLLVLDSCYAGAFSFDPERDLKGSSVSYRGAPSGIDEDTALERLEPPTRRYLTAVGRDVTPDDSRFSAELIAFLASDAPAYVTDLSLAAHLEGVRPSPRYGRFEGDQEAGAIVFRPTTASPRPP